jgi:hypothetical protein
MLTVNGLPVNSMRWRATWSGVWVAELDYTSEGVALPPGRVVIVGTEGIALTGTIDAELSGKFGEKYHLRVLGGGGGWHRDVRAQHFHSDAGLPIATVVSTTAAEAGEVATVLVPSVVGLDFVRRAGPASQIFEDAGVDWWVGVDGVTRVGARIPAPAPLSLEILDWNPGAGTVSFRCDVLVEPGAIVVDTALRFTGPRIVREVEATVSEGSVSGTLWLVETPPALGTVSELADSLAAIARAGTKIEAARFYEYLVVAMAGDRVQLAATRPAPFGTMPAILPVSIWAGASGYKASLTPGSRVLVGFIEGDPRKPYVAFYEPPDADSWRPVTNEIDATAAVTVGALAAAVVLGEAATARPVARLTESLTTWIAAVSTYINGLAPGTVVPPVDIASAKVVAS